MKNTECLLVNPGVEVHAILRPFFPVCFQKSVLARTTPSAGQETRAIATTRTGALP